MALPIEDYAADRRPSHRRPGRGRRLDRLAVPAALRLPRLLRRPARHRQTTAAGCSAPVERVRPSRAATSTTHRLLETTFTTADGEVRLLDVMPTERRAADLVRRLVGVDGTVRIRHDWVVRTDYGRVRPWVTPRAAPRHRGHRRGRRCRTSWCCAARGCRWATTATTRRVRRLGRRRAHLLDDLDPLVAGHPRPARARARRATGAGVAGVGRRGARTTSRTATPWSAAC